MPRGILSVSSRLAHPSTPRPGIPPLNAEKFCSWYEDAHILEVTALEGIVGARRWESVSVDEGEKGGREGGAGWWSDAAPWLTVYEMPDLEYRLTSAFTGLDGQKTPKKELLHGIFEQARFDSRFYEDVDVDVDAGIGSESGYDEDGSAKFLVSWVTDSVSVSMLSSLREIAGFKRLRQFKLVSASTLDRFVRREAVGVGRLLVLVEFEGESIPAEAVREVTRGNNEKEGMDEEVGWYRLVRVYGVDVAWLGKKGG